MPDNSRFHLPSHHPHGLKDELLGYTTYASTICKIIRELAPANTGLTVGIFGDWGVGKSSILKMIQEELGNQEKSFLLVRFEAWRYTKQEDLWLALLRAILTEVKKKLGSGNLLWVNWKLGTRHLGVSSWIRTIWELVRSIFFWFFGQINISLPAIPDLSHLSKPGFDRGQSLAVDDFRADFQTVIEVIGKQLVILIDDLDRCPNDQIVPVLEAIKHFGFDRSLTKQLAFKQSLLLALSDYLGLDLVDIPQLKQESKQQFAGIAFILAADRRAIERAVSVHYEDYQKLEKEKAERFAREYVEKIVQIPFDLPPLRRTHLARLLETQTNG